MDGFKETPCRAPLLKGKGCFGDEIRGVRPGNVNAEEFACAFFGNDFEESGKRAIPCSRACSSVNPTSPISGEVKMAEGTTVYDCTFFFSGCRML